MKTRAQKPNQFQAQKSAKRTTTKLNRICSELLQLSAQQGNSVWKNRILSRIFVSRSVHRGNSLLKKRQLMNQLQSGNRRPEPQEKDR